MFVIIFTTKIKQANFIAGRREVLFIFLELYEVLEIVHINVCTVGVVDIHDHHQHYNLKWHALQGGFAKYNIRTSLCSWCSSCRPGQLNLIQPVKDKHVIYLNSEHIGKCFRIFSATEILAASINSSTIWFASRIWYIPVDIIYALG